MRVREGRGGGGGEIKRVGEGTLIVNMNIENGAPPNGGVRCPRKDHGGRR